jgi:hypothetical protein
MTPANDNIPYWPRGLSRVLAAAYIGVSPSFFDALVKDGRMPQAKPINSRRVWDRLLLDMHFEALDGKVMAKSTEGSWDDIAA